MAKHNVKCRTCGASFDANEYEYVKFGSFYYHKECFWLDDKAIERGILFVCERLLGQEYNEYKIKRQIKAYISQNITRKDILKSLQYWYFVKKNDISKANGGIGIVGFIYQEAEEYFKNQERIKKAAENVDVESFLNPDTVQFSIKPKQSHLAKGTKGFNLI